MTLIEQMMQSGLEDTQCRAAQDIIRNRKGHFILNVTRSGQPVDAKVHFELDKHDFDFGSNIFMLDQYDDPQQETLYRKNWLELFNTAVIPLYWEGTEPQQGYLRYSKDVPNDVYRRPQPDRVVEYCQQQGVRMKGHPLFWHEFIPRWLPKDWNELYPLLEKRFAEISARYADTIPVFDVVNEPARIWDMGFEHKTDGYKMIAPPEGYVEQVFALAEKYFPHNTKILNEAVGAALCEFKGPYGGYYLLVEKLLNQGVNIDRVGLQCHTGENPVFRNVFNGERLYGILDGYAKLGKPLVMSEISISTDNEESQAMAAEQLYKICFSHNSMSGIFWWNLDDNGILTTKNRQGATGENLPHGGLVRNGCPKAAYKALHKLIKQDWHTQGEALLAQGQAQFDGFYGSYRVTVEAEGIRETRTVCWNKGGETEVTIAL